MFLLGLLSLVQIGYLPGYIILRYLKAKTNPIQTLVFSFALSLIFNYILVFGLVSLGIYHQLILYCLFVAELMILGLNTNFEAVKHWFLMPVSESLASVKNYFGIKRYMKDEYSKATRVIVGTSYFLALVAIILVIYQILNQTGTLFQLWDAIVSWNRWALDWYNNRYPSLTWHYPQLIPANWSISYLFLMRPLQYFPKAIMSCFTLFLLLLVFDLARTKHSSAHLVGMVLIGYIYLHDFRRAITDGFVDIAVSFMVFLAVYCLLIIGKNDSQEKRLNFLMLGAIFAAGSAVTKQAGLYILCVYPLLTLFLVKKDYEIDKKSWDKFIITYICSTVMIVLPFYILTQIRIYLGLDSSEINTVTNLIYHGKNLFERFPPAVESASSLFDPKILFFIFCPFVLFSLKDKVYRSIGLFVLIPYFFIWALLYSYDLRNLIPVLPFFGLAIAVGLREAFHRMPRFSFKPRICLKNIYMVGLVLLLMVFLNFYFSPASLVNSHHELEKRIYNPGLDQLLYQYYTKNKINKKILTDYQPLGFLPDLKKFYKLQYSFEELDLIIKKKEIGYLLLPDYIPDSVRKDVLKMERSGSLEIVFHAYDYMFLKIIEDKR